MDDDGGGSTSRILKASSEKGRRAPAAKAPPLGVQRLSTKLAPRLSTKLAPRRGSASHARFVEEEAGVEEEGSLGGLDEDGEESNKRRAGAPGTVLSRSASRTASDGARRNTARGEWSSAEEVVLARKHMELGNKWTNISHFLPARSDNDVKNIWHSTLRSKNTERRSFLRTYARAVRDCANDAEARRQAYEMAQRVCGAPPPIDLALAQVQQQYQQQLLLQAQAQDESLEQGQSPEHEQHDQERDSGRAGEASAQGHEAQDRDRSPLLQLQPPEEPHVEACRSGTCSCTISAMTGADALQGNGSAAPTGRISPARSPLHKRQQRPLQTLGSGPAPLESMKSVPGAVGQFPFALPSDGRVRSHSHSFAHSFGGVASEDTTGSLPQSRASDFDSSCLSRLAALHLADQLQRQQLQQQLSGQAEPFGATTSASGQQGRILQAPLQQLPHGRSLSGTSQHVLVRGSATDMAAQPHEDPGGPLAGGNPGGAPADMDDLLALGLDLTPDDLLMLGQGGSGGAADCPLPGGAPATAEHALGLTRSIYQQQQHQFVASAQAAGAPHAAALHVPGQQLPGPPHPLAAGSGGVPGTAMAVAQAQPGGVLETLLAELDGGPHPGVCLHKDGTPTEEAQGRMLGAGPAGAPQAAREVAGSTSTSQHGGFPATAPGHGAAGFPTRSSGPHAFVAAGQQSVDMMRQQQQLHHPAGGPGALMPLAAAQGTAGGAPSRLAMGGNMLSPLGLPHGAVQGQAVPSGPRFQPPWSRGVGHAGLAATLLRSDNSGVRTLSSPAPFCGEATPAALPGGGGVGGGGFPLMPGGPAAAGFRGPGAAAGGGGGAHHPGLVGDMPSLAELTATDVVTMGLESGDLLDTLMAEATVVHGAGPATVDAPDLGLGMGMEALQARVDLGMGMSAVSAGSGQAAWSLSAPPTHTGRIGPMLRHL